MTKAIFILNRESIYDDLPEKHYHFPKQYLGRIQKTIDDWIIYYESGKNKGRKVYFATARVRSVESDVNKPDHFYAKVSDYLGFNNPVPLKEENYIYEAALRGEAGEIRGGISQNAVRPISEQEYHIIAQAGFGHLITPDEKMQISESHDPNLGFQLSEEQMPFERPIIEQIVRRPFREAAFAENVKNAYDKTCAITGLKIINGGGKAEVHAAHIQPVEDSGPDSIRNGLALSRTVHWMFDRGLFSISDDYKILTAKDKIPKEIEQLLRPNRELILPKQKNSFPHAQFLKYHRENVFKG